MEKSDMLKVRTNADSVYKIAKSPKMKNFGERRMRLEKHRQSITHRLPLSVEHYVIPLGHPISPPRLFDRSNPRGTYTAST